MRREDLAVAVGAALVLWLAIVGLIDVIRWLPLP